MDRVADRHLHALPLWGVWRGQAQLIDTTLLPNRRIDHQGEILVHTHLGHRDFHPAQAAAGAVEQFVAQFAGRAGWHRLRPDLKPFEQPAGIGKSLADLSAAVDLDKRGAVLIDVLINRLGASSAGVQSGSAVRIIGGIQAKTVQSQRAQHQHER